MSQREGLLQCRQLDPWTADPVILRPHAGAIGMAQRRHPRTTRAQMPCRQFRLPGLRCSSSVCVNKRGLSDRQTEEPERSQRYDSRRSGGLYGRSSGLRAFDEHAGHAVFAVGRIDS